MTDLPTKFRGLFQTQRENGGLSRRELLGRAAGAAETLVGSQSILGCGTGRRLGIGERTLYDKLERYGIN